MHYLGGKSRLAKRICAILEGARRPGQRFVDAFSGPWNITAAMDDHGPRVANDACQPLVTLARAWLNGWRPPAEVSEQLYREVKARKDPTDPLTAFVGFGCSYGGKWFAGYARRPIPKNLSNTQLEAIRKDGRIQTVIGLDYGITQQSVSRAKSDTTPAVEALKGLEEKLTRCQDVRFVCSDFADLEILPGDLVYCDSPYRGTTAYGYFRGFDYDRYLSKLTEWSAIADVFVSEYAAQADTWEQVAEFAQSATSAQLHKGRTERLYRVR
jgi:DNA adenine methylase